jgi:hypothetical protein
MSIPLDRLYHYIENIAKEIRSDDVLIYRFWPHGSKKIEDLLPIIDLTSDEERCHQSRMQIQILCNDQEPLNFQLYQNINIDTLEKLKFPVDLLQSLDQHQIECLNNNLRSAMPIGPFNIYDKCVLLHSEKRSTNLNLYSNDQYVPSYYWSHAFIALDWFRYAEHAKLEKNQSTKTFLIYNRAWSGSREYRLKFADLLVDYKLIDDCLTSVGFVDNGLHYDQHIFVNQKYRPINHLENYFKENQTTSCYSADFDLSDYNSTLFEVVLETLFDDDRIHLTEKVLRPIALGQPFILCATHGSLEFLQTYGFKTFDSVFDERYDTIIDPFERLEAIVKLMKEITSWDSKTQHIKMKQIQEIVNYNQQHFFSKHFFDQINNELKNNLCSALDQVEKTNTSSRYINLRKSLVTTSQLRDFITLTDRTQLAKAIKQARKYYNHHHNK